MSETITLKYPVTVKGQPYETLSFRRPKARDLRALDEAKGSQSKRTFDLMANLAAVEPEVILELDTDDLGQINAWLEPILDPKGQLLKDAGS